MDLVTANPDRHTALQDLNLTQTALTRGGVQHGGEDTTPLCLVPPKFARHRRTPRTPRVPVPEGDRGIARISRTTARPPAPGPQPVASAPCRDVKEVCEGQFRSIPPPTAPRYARHGTASARASEERNLHCREVSRDRHSKTGKRTCVSSSKKKMLFFLQEENFLLARRKFFKKFFYTGKLNPETGIHFLSENFRFLEPQSGSIRVGLGAQ